VSVNNNEKIYIAGHRGLVGSALVRRLNAVGFTNLTVRAHDELELTDQAAVRQFFKSERPDYVFLAAAKVGGIYANNTYPADFIYDNIGVQTNVIHAAWQHGVKRLLFLGSSCIYPRDCPQPMQESHLLSGPLEPTNRPYAVAKIAGVEMCWAFNRQYGTRFLSVMPTNLYGPGDNYDLPNCHVLPALIRKMHEAKMRGDKQVTIWGTGNARREFLYVDDMANACILLMKLPDVQFNSLISSDAGDSNTAALPPLINIGCGADLTVRALAETIARIVGFKGALVFDTTKPDGTPRKLLDVSRIQELNWRPEVEFAHGVSLAYEDFLRTVMSK
jgi:GDP-L-fucose synthase